MLLATPIIRLRLGSNIDNLVPFGFRYRAEIALSAPCPCPRPRPRSLANRVKRIGTRSVAVSVWGHSGNEGLEQRSVRGNAGDDNLCNFCFVSFVLGLWEIANSKIPTYTQAGLHTGPDHDILAVGVGLQVPNGEDADYLDDGHEETESKQASQEDFLFEAELEFPKDWQR